MVSVFLRKKLQPRAAQRHCFLGFRCPQSAYFLVLPTFIALIGILSVPEYQELTSIMNGDSYSSRGTSILSASTDPSSNLLT